MSKLDELADNYRIDNKYNERDDIETYKAGFKKAIDLLRQKELEAYEFTMDSDVFGNKTKYSEWLETFMEEENKNESIVRTKEK